MESMVAGAASARPPLEHIQMSECKELSQELEASREDNELWVCKKCTYSNPARENVYHCDMCDSFQPREPPILECYGKGDVTKCGTFPERSPMHYRRLYYLHNLTGSAPASASACKYPYVPLPLDIARIVVENYLLFDYAENDTVDVCYGHVWYSAKVINLLVPKHFRKLDEFEDESDEDEDEDEQDEEEQHSVVQVQVQAAPNEIIHQRLAPVHPGLIYQRIGHPGAGGSSGGWQPIDPDEIKVNFVQIRYDGWSDRWDEWLPVNSGRLEPYRAKSVGDTSAQKTRHLHMARTPRISIEDVQAIMELGYQWADAQTALLLTNNNVDNAIALLQTSAAQQQQQQLDNVDDEPLAGEEEDEEAEDDDDDDDGQIHIDQDL
jgi:hypothetical protein